MEQLIQASFLTVLNMSITASYMILFVMLARLLLKKAPKGFSYSLWAVVLFRLICPVSFSSTVSFLGFMKAPSMEHIPANLSRMAQPQVNLGINELNQAINSSLPAVTPMASANPMQIILFLSSVVWVLGILSLMIYSVVSYRLLHRNVRTAMRLKDNIFECETIQSPFVLGILKPRIYLPIGFPESEKSYILKHEEIHIQRFDYLIKPLAFLVLCVHWFNPLVWISFILMTKDMEMSCDERVLRDMGSEIKKDYSSSLLSLAVSRKIISGSPLAFGESNVKSRIKNVLNYRRPTFWAVVLAVGVILVLSVGLMANPRSNEPDLSFLNINNTATVAVQHESLMIRAHGQGASIISGNVFGRWLYKTSVNWQETKVPSPFELAPTLSIYINNSVGHEVRFYESEPELAMVLYDGHYRYYSIPTEAYNEVYRMYALRSYGIPEAVVNAIVDGKRTTKQSVQDIPVGVEYKVLRFGNTGYYIYQKGGNYYCELPYQFITEITEAVYINALEFAENPTEVKRATVSPEIVSLVEDRLSVIMSSPQQSSNPGDYVLAHQNAYEDILKNGGEEALSYLLSQFEQGNADGLRGHLMMSLCKKLLGERNNVSDEALSPKAWFSQLAIRQKVDLSDFAYSGDDPIERLVYATEVQKHKGSRGEFTIVAPHIFGSYQEGNQLKVFVTTCSHHYFLYDKTLAEEGGSIIPAAITYLKNQDGSYTLEKYEQARDGSEFGPSIKDYCVMPVSGKKISGLSDKILAHYSDYQDIIKLERENLIEHLNVNAQHSVWLFQKHYQKPAELIQIT